MKVLFLDFDGVLHSNYDSDAALWTFLPHVEAVLRDYPEVRIVVSSSWGYVLTHPVEYGEGQTFAQLFFARRRRAIEKQVSFMDYMRPQTPPLSDDEMIERYGYAPEQLRDRGWRSRK